MSIVNYGKCQEVYVCRPQNNLIVTDEDMKLNYCNYFSNYTLLVKTCLYNIIETVSFKDWSSELTFFTTYTSTSTNS